MPPEITAIAATSSGWTSWAPEVADAVELAEPAADVDLLGVLSLLMWGCASLLAVWYL